MLEPDEPKKMVIDMGKADIERLCVLGFAIVLGVGLRSYFMASSMTYDESYTFLTYVNRNWGNVFNYSMPNNHIFHTILVKISTLIWGAHPLTIRLPSFLAGIVSIPLVFVLSRKIMGGEKYGVGAVLLAVTPYMIYYSANARGYTIIVCLSLVMICLGLECVDNPTLAKSVLIAAIASIGIYTIPTMVFPVAGVYLWVVCLCCLRRYELKNIVNRFIIPVSIFTVIFVIILYIPVVLITNNGINSIISNRFVTPQEYGVFFNELIPHICSTFISLTRNVPNVVISVFFMFVMFGLLKSIINKNYKILLLLPCMIVGSSVILILKHRIPFGRTWIFFIPVFIIVAEYGFYQLLNTFPEYMKNTVISVLISVCIIVSFNVFSGKTFIRDSNTSLALVSLHLKRVINKNDTIHYGPGLWPSAKFYLWYNGVLDKQLNIVSNVRRREKGTDYFIQNISRESIEEMTKNKVVKLIDLGSIVLYKNAAPH